MRRVACYSVTSILAASEHAGDFIGEHVEPVVEIALQYAQMLSKGGQPELLVAVELDLRNEAFLARRSDTGLRHEQIRAECSRTVRTGRSRGVRGRDGRSRHDPADMDGGSLTERWRGHHRLSRAGCLVSEVFE